MARKTKLQKKRSAGKHAPTHSEHVDRKLTNLPDPLLQQAKQDLVKTVVLAFVLFVLEFAIFFVSVNGMVLNKFFRI